MRPPVCAGEIVAVAGLEGEGPEVGLDIVVGSEEVGAEEVVGPEEAGAKEVVGPEEGIEEAGSEGGSGEVAGPEGGVKEIGSEGGEEHAARPEEDDLIPASRDRREEGSEEVGEYPKI